MAPLSLGVAALASAGMAVAAPLPELPPLAYDPAADEACAAGPRAAIDHAWVAELQDRLPEAQALWRQLAPRMFAAASTLVGRTVPPPRSPVRLTLCPIPSQASPEGPVVNMRFALRSFTATPVSLSQKIDTAFHESLHPFLATLDPARSALLQAQRREPACVQNHLHLLSLQKAVLLSLGQEQALRDLVAMDEQLPSGCYRRAWAIVNASPDTYRGYVHELATGG